MNLQMLSGPALAKVGPVHLQEDADGWGARR